jgi:hypothetical protein
MKLMKKIVILSLVISVFVLTGCSNEDANNVVSEINNQVTQEEFNKLKDETTNTQQIKQVQSSIQGQQIKTTEATGTKENVGVVKEEMKSLVNDTASKYKTVNINNSEITFLFDVPVGWDVVSDTDNHVPSSNEEKGVMSFVKKQGIIASVNSDIVHYSDAAYSQVDFSIKNKVEVDKMIAEAKATEDSFACSSSKEVLLEKPIIKSMKIGNYKAISIDWPTDIDESGNKVITKCASGGKDLFIFVEDNKILHILKQSSITKNNFNKGFDHLLSTFKVLK